MSKRSRIITVICALMFVVGIITGLVGRAICVRNNGQYEKIQPELFAPDEIATVLFSEKAHRLYVCYNDASYVNVYSPEGKFLWAVSTPYLRNEYFELLDDKLIIYDEEAYVYDASNGDFIEKCDADSLNLNYDFENDMTDRFEPGKYYFDTYQVYKADSSGALITIVERPWWYWLFNFGICWLVAFCGGAGIGILYFLSSRRDYREVKSRSLAKNGKLFEKNKKAAFVLKYYKINTAISLIYTAANIFCGIFFDGILCIGLFPVGIHFIISNIITVNMLDTLSISEDEATVINHWRLREIVTFVIAFFSVALVALFCA